MKRAIAIALLVSARAFAGHVADHELVGETAEGVKFYWDRAVQQRGRVVDGVKMPDRVVYTQTEMDKPNGDKIGIGYLIDCEQKLYAMSWIFVSHPDDRESESWGVNDSHDKLDWKPLDDKAQLLYPKVCK